VISTTPPTTNPSLTQAFVVAVADASLPNARVLKAGVGLSLVDGGPSGLTLSRGRADYIDAPYYYEPFWGGLNSYFINGSSSGTITAQSGTAASPGGLILTVSNNGQYAYYATSPTMLRFGGLAVEFQTTVSNPTLSVSGQTYTFRVGFLDVAGADTVDGVYFEYDSTLSLNWRICTSNNSTRTKTNTTVPVAINTDYVLYFIVNAAGSLASFYINGVLVGTITTNIPTAAGRECALAMQLDKTSGNTARTFNVDYMFFQAGV